MAPATLAGDFEAAERFRRETGEWVETCVENASKDGGNSAGGGKEGKEKEGKKAKGGKKGKKGKEEKEGKEGKEGKEKKVEKEERRKPESAIIRSFGTIAAVVGRVYDEGMYLYACVHHHHSEPFMTFRDSAYISPSTFSQAHIQRL